MSQPSGWATRSPAQRGKVGSFQCPASTGNYVVSGVGFTPSLLTFQIGLASGDYVANGWGMADAAGNQSSGSNIYRRSTALGSSDMSLVRCITIRNEANSANYIQASLVSMDADGFTLNFTAVNTGFHIAWQAHA